MLELSHPKQDVLFALESQLVIPLLNLQYSPFIQISLSLGERKKFATVRHLS